jgi:hypothetical protein
MNRLCHAIPDLETLLGGRPAPQPVEALLVSGPGLARILRRELSELHERRRLTAGTPAEADLLREIQYWANVLDWAKDQPAGEFVLTARRE